MNPSGFSNYLKPLFELSCQAQFAHAESRKNEFKYESRYTQTAQTTLAVGSPAPTSNLPLIMQSSTWKLPH